MTVKLRKGKADYALPPYHQIISVSIDVDGMEMPVPLMPPWQTTRTMGAGRPQICRVRDHHIFFEPTPDKQYTASIIYAPPLAKI